MRNGDDPVLTEKDSESAEDMLKAVVIRIFIDKKITHAEFSRRHREYMLSIGESTKNIASSRNNLVTAITTRKTLTYRMFELILKNILQLNLGSFSMSFKDADNKPYIVSMDRMTY